jgi:hypothetical protein
MHKFLFLALVTVSPAFAQSQTAADLRTAAGCGSVKTHFDVKIDKSQHAGRQPDADKALVFVVEEYDSDPHSQVIGHVTTRVGLDGTWVGASHQGSAISFAVDAGAHHLCSDVQSIVPGTQKLSAAVDLVAEAGKTYYYRVVLRDLPKEPLQLRFLPMDDAEGLLTASKSSLSIARAKN